MPTLKEIQAKLKTEREKAISESIKVAPETNKELSVEFKNLNIKKPKLRKTPKDQKDNVITTRVNDRLYKVLREYAKDSDIKLSEITREALRFYDSYVIQRINHIPIMIIPKNEYATILEHLNEKDIKHLVDVALINAYQEIEKIKQEISEKQGFDVGKMGFSPSPRMLMASLKKTFFSEKGQNWFKIFEYRFLGKGKLMIAGVHEINNSFSLFMKEYLKKFLDRINNYKLIEEKAVLTDDKIVLYFQRKKVRLKRNEKI